MTGSDLHTRLQQLHLEAERISNNLVELEIDPTRQLLEASRLEGASAERWSAANAALTELWRRRGLLEALLERADRAHQGDELKSLLEGQQIELAGGMVPLAERHLLDTTRVRDRCSAEELVVWMVAAFDEVKGVITQLGRAWDTLAPKLDTARRLLAEAQQLSRELEEPGVDDPEPIVRAIERLSARLATDPLSMSAQEVEEVEREARAFRARIQDASALRRGWDTRLAQARSLLEGVHATLAQAQAAHEELTLKILLPDPPPVPSMPEGLDADLDRIAEIPGREGWPEAGRALEAWTETAESALHQLRRALDASRAPIQARNQYRALLDAYKVKAQRLGLLEDRELQDLFSEAHEVLYNAPSDLALSAQLVRSYQAALSRPTTPREEVSHDL